MYTGPLAKQAPTTKYVHKQTQTELLVDESLQCDRISLATNFKLVNLLANYSARLQVGRRWARGGGMQQNILLLYI